MPKVNVPATPEEAELHAKRQSFKARDTAAMKQNANAANSVPQLRAIVAELAEVVAELQRILAD